MTDILNASQRRKHYYKIYRKITTSAQWIRSIYNPKYPMTKTYLSPIIFSVRKIGNELLELADILEKSLND